MNYNNIKLLFKRNYDNVMLFAILLISIAVMSFANNKFLQLGTFESLAYQLPEMGLLTLAMMVTMISGGINLSCIASANLSGILMAMMMTRLIPAGGDNVPLILVIMAAGVLVSIAVGVLNGIVIANFRVPAMLATLGTQMLMNGICLILTKGEIISGYPPSFLFIGNGTLGPIPMPLAVFIICGAIMAVSLKLLPLGSQIYMYGSNPVATEFSGVNVKRMLLKTYAFSGFFVGIAAILLTSRFNSAAAGYAESYLLQAVLIAVLGGVNPNGGAGRVTGVALSLIILQVVASGLNLLRISSYLNMALWGLILLLAVAIRSRRSRA